MSLLVEKARAFALAAHAGKFRPNKGREPYSFHIEEVAIIVKKAGGSEAEETAAWLHDAPEDNKNVTIKEVYRLFGPEVGQVVEDLTDPKWPEGISIFERKKIQVELIKRKGKSSKLVKKADQASNVKSVILDPVIGWTPEDCRDYIMGANLIADQCRGISKWLDDYFDELYTEAKKVYGF